MGTVQPPHVRTSQFRPSLSPCVLCSSSLTGDPCPVGLLQDHPLWPPTPHARFPCCFLVFPQSLFLTKTDLDHLHSEPCHLGARVRPEWQGVQVRGLPAAVGSGEGGRRVHATEHGRERHLGNASCYLNADGSCLVQSLSHSFSFHINLPPQPDWMLLVPIATCCSCKATPALCPVRRYPQE